MNAGAGGLRDTNQHQLSRAILCLPTAPGCQLWEAGTSVGRRFLGSSQASKAIDLTWMLHCLEPMYQSLTGAVARLVGIEGGVVSGVINLESSGVRASDRVARAPRLGARSSTISSSAACNDPNSSSSMGHRGSTRPLPLSGTACRRVGWPPIGRNGCSLSWVVDIGRVDPAATGFHDMK